MKRYALLLLLPLLLFQPNPTAAQHHGHHDPGALGVDPRLAQGQIAPVLEGLGEVHHPVTTTSPEAQLFFDQGLALTYGFNHREALRAFKEAARLDPECAMAYWGWALVLGPNLNLPMDPQVVTQAHEAVGKALALRDKVSESERAYIDALARRYGPDPETDRVPLDVAYATAMKQVHLRYPKDDDAATLYAAALMNLSPWNYWTPDGQPQERTPEILATLEGVMARNAEHIGALHYYIHAVEPVDPARGIVAADALRGLAPGSGHLVHMPSHIYMQVGRYAEAYQVNLEASTADARYITQCRAQGIYALGYFPHNLHFMVWAGTQLGRSEDALRAAREVASKVPGDQEDNDWGLYQTFLSAPITTLARFGRFEEVLAEPEPPEGLAFWRAMAHFSRGLALGHGGDLEAADRELAVLVQIAEDPEAQAELVGLSGAAGVLPIARHILAGELAARRGDFDRALLHLDRAQRHEDRLIYNEPPDWPIPVRHYLGATLLEAGRPEEAEVVYWQDLARYPENGFALFGLWQSLVAQGREEEAAAMRQRYDAAWADADRGLVSSRF
jgi:tetratricopeptide (TPR) repeat protein